MNKPLSLRTTLLVGLVVLNAAVILGITSTVYGRVRAQAHAAMQNDLRLRAITFASGVEIEKQGLDFEAPQGLTTDYMEPDSGAYAVVYDTEGEAVVRSPSLGDDELAPTAGWVEGAFVFGELEGGPDGIPCATVTHSFVVKADKARKDGSWAPPPPSERRYQIVIAADSRPRDEALAGMLGFLFLIGGVAFGGTVLGGLALSRVVLRPIRRITREAAKLSPEDTSKRLRPATVVRELQSLSETVNSALDRLGSALDAQRRFASDASHELRTPLAILLGNADVLLRHDRDNEQYKRGLERQRRVAKRMTDITNNLLELARADAGFAKIGKMRVALPELTQDIVHEIETVATADGVELQCTAAGDIDVVGDPTYLSGLIQNLVANAVKFTPAGGRVDVRVAQEGEYARVDVADTGPGIPEEHQSHVFDRFFRVNEGKDQNEGAGLGLSIVNWIVRAHDGLIAVRNRPQGGAHFSVKLPLYAAAA